MDPLHGKNLKSSLKEKKRIEEEGKDAMLGFLLLEYEKQAKRKIKRNVEEARTKQYLDLISKYEKEFPGVAPLLIACEKGRFDDVKFLITYNKSISVNEPQNYYCHWGSKTTPLMIAAVNEHFQIVKYLIEQCEADPNIADSAGWNALHYAAWYNRKNTKVTELLLTNMSLNSINKKDSDGNTPLDNAYINDSSMKQKIIDLIHKYGGLRAIKVKKTEFSTLTKELYTDLVSKYKKEFPEEFPFIIACEHGRFDDVKLFIKCDKSISINKVWKNSRGFEYTPLMLAAKNENFRIVQYFIEIGADPNITTSDGLNVLHTAASNWNRKKNTDMIQYLLTHMSADSINQKDRYGNTPLDWAMSPSSVPNKRLQQNVITLIREYGRLRTKELVTPPLKEEPEVIISKYNELRAEEVTQTKEELLAMYEKEFPNATPFICACERGRLQDVKEFHYYNMQVDEGYDSNGNKISAINIIIKHGHMGLFKYLIENFKRIQFLNTDDGWTMLHYGALYLQSLKEFKYLDKFFLKKKLSGEK